MNDHPPDTRPTEAAKRPVAALYSSVADDYARQGPPLFAHAGHRLVDLVGIRPGDRVLDVATGRGAALFPAAARAGPAGRVVGIDLAAGMVRATRADAGVRGLSQVEVRRADAEALDRSFPRAAFDRALCGF